MREDVQFWLSTAHEMEFGFDPFQIRPFVGRNRVQVTLEIPNKIDSATQVKATTLVEEGRHSRNFRGSAPQITAREVIGMR